ncbi:hypothetical protein VA7868_00173 [Vibrio aerogenes CECT 7868]|uniref:N-acetyltransferase domain-containing protein n=1 Tax=Vibrio aerogenes CECT 7868 TaxID=1216006 RepID=A0A1M5UUI3_9VIBR|nr:GNAT family N-acetyltransferase [Vibrio aerogenes]SHH66413.1 hypothetical protein VA7868_00173 [Vibrio aerogenes CECT 7868]
MHIDSDGIRSDMIFHHFSGQVTEKENYVVVKTPSNPGFYWGNYLVFPQPPLGGDFLHWRHLFVSEFRNDQDVKHMSFCWLKPTEHIQTEYSDFLSQGFEYDEVLVLKGSQFCLPGRRNEEIQCRPVLTDAEWQQVIALHLLVYPDSCRNEAECLYVDRTYAAYRSMQAAGLGGLHGAFIGDQLVASLGLFFDGEIGRFQNVETHPDFRQRGICKTMVYDISVAAMQQHPQIRHLILHADSEYIAAEIYRSVGYEVCETICELCLTPEAAAR